MNLVPMRPPGPNARKARAFAVDLLRLRSQGYTFEAIREALAGAGINVSNSTVQREVARAATHASVLPSAFPAPSDQNPATQSSVPPARQRAKECNPPVTTPLAAKDRAEASGTSIQGPSGKDVAEAFMATQTANPFIRAKEQP